MCLNRIVALENRLLRQCIYKLHLVLTEKANPMFSQYEHRYSKSEILEDFFLFITNFLY